MGNKPEDHAANLRRENKRPTPGVAVKDRPVSLLVFGLRQPDLLIRVRLFADRDADPHVDQLVQRQDCPPGSWCRRFHW